MYGKVWAPHFLPISSESHWVWLRAPSALRSTLTRPRYEFCPRPALMPLLTIFDLVRLPTWIILVPVSACWQLLVTATE